MDGLRGYALETHFCVWFLSLISGGGKAKAEVMQHKTRLQAELARLKVRRKAISNDELVVAQLDIAQYLRVVVELVPNAVSILEKDLAPLKFAGNIDPGVDWEKLVATQTAFFYVDVHVPHLYVFGPAITSLPSCSLVQDSRAVIQQKASCLPPLLLSQCLQRRPCSAVDACAAPGNKTTYLASLLGVDSSVVAYERDSGRFVTLCNRTKHIKSIKCVEADFLLADVSQSDAELIMVDPSCSGSGIVTRIAFEDADGGNVGSMGMQRLASLSAFQTRAVVKAMSFPRARFVIYSTCSVHREENEDVVQRVLEQCTEWRLMSPWSDKWTSRGFGSAAQGCMRVDAKAHRTIGFFVALFEKT